MRTTGSKQTSFGADILLFSLLLSFTVSGHSVMGAQPVRAGDSVIPVIAPDANSPNESPSPISSEQQHHGCMGGLDMPLSIDLSTDSAKLAKGVPTSVSGVMTVQAALKDVHVRVRAKGNAEILPGATFDYDFLAQGQVVDFTIPVRFNDNGISQVFVDVTAVIAGTEFPFGKRAELNVLLRPEQILTGGDVPRHLQIRAIRQDLQAGRITQELADTQIKNLSKLEGTFDHTPYPVIEQSPQERALLEGLRLSMPEARDTNKRPSARGSVSLRVHGLVQWRDENNVNHPVYGMTVQVRDDETVGSELVRVMATDTNGQYDTGWFTQDDGWLAGNPDIFVRFRSENSVIDVEDGCFLCGTYENDTAIYDEFPGGEIIENFTCSNTGTGPACSVLTGVTWIALYAHNLNNNNWLGKIRVDWPGDSGSANYNCTPACRLNLRPGDKWDWDVMHHEYGHYVMDEFDFEDNPGGTHYLTTCHAITRGNKDDGMKLAWAEGWPTFFGTAGQWQLNMAALNVPRVGDVNYTDTGESSFGYSLEDNTGGIIPSWGSSGRGEDNELAVQRVFWDLVDTNSDSRDTVTVSDKTLFDIVDIAGPHSLNAAWAPIRATLSNADDFAYGGVLTDHLIAPTPLNPLAGAIVTQFNASFSWEPNVGCDPSFAGDIFDLVFYNQSGSSKILTIGGLTTTSHTLTPVEFQTVAAQGPGVIWAVEARNSASPVTGPYLGAGSLIYVYNPPANDNCASAAVISDGTVQGTTFGATSDGQTSCNLISEADVWYSYQATCNGFLKVDTCGSTYDTIVSVYDGCPGHYQNELDCNRNCSGSPCGGGNSCLTGSRVPVTQGQTYLIRVGGWVAEEGDFTLNVSCIAQSDSCGEATNVAIGSTTEGSTVGASVDPAPTCNNVTVTAPGVWYTVYGTGNEMTASLCDAATNFDTKISVYCGGCGNRDCRAANDDACAANRSEVTWCSTPGAIYHILVHGFGTDMGDFKLRVTDTGNYCGPFYRGCFPPNNTCSTAIDISGTIIGDNTGTSTTGSASCVDSQNDVWYRYTPNCDGVLVISTCGAQGTLSDTVLSVYDACGGRELACNDDGGGSCGTRAKLEIPVTADEPILIRVADYGTGLPDQGTFPLSISMRVAPIRVSPPGFYVTPSDGVFDDHLVRLDLDSNTVIEIGPLGISSVWGLAFDSNLGIMFGVSDMTEQLVTVDLTTGAATPIGLLGFNNVGTLGFDASSNSLYGVDQFTSPEKLLEINPVSGAATYVGDVTGGLSFLESLSFDPGSGLLYSAVRTSSGTANNLATIDVSTGAGAVVGSFGGDFDFVTGLAFDAATGALYGTQYDQSLFDGRLMRIDKATGAATQVGTTYADMGPGGLEIVPGLPDGTLDQPYTGRIPITGGCPPYTLANVMGLPVGLSTNGHDTILGTPTEAGVFTISFDVGDTNLSTSLISVSLPLRVRPENDDCAQAISVGTGDTPFTTLGALTDGPVEQALCTFAGDPRVQQDVWFCHQATCTGQLTVSLCGSDYDTKLAVYEGCSCPTSSSAIACDDDGCAAGNLQSEATFAVTSGQSYLIRVGGFSGNAGSGTMSISCTECALDTDCNDGNLCTDDVCVNGMCTVTYKTCDDGNLCTTDACTPATGCSNTPIRCDDQNACTTETCNPVTGICDASPISCDDGNLCTTDSCDPTQGCVFAPVSCDDGDACTDDACDGATGQCVTSPTSCDDRNPCSIDTCDAVTGCTHTFGGQPDTDCNGNGTDDACDIFSGTSLDCNGNGIPDECDLGTGAGFHPIDFSAYHNGNLQGVDPGFPSGNVVLGGVPFDIPTTPNNYWHSAAEAGPNPRVIDISVNRFGVGEVHTLINTYWGQPGPTAYAWLEFFGANGAYYRKDLIGNEDIRDFNQLFFTNNINGATTTNVVTVGSHRLDKQTIALPADFLDETLLNIKVSDNGGDNFQRIFLAGITTLAGGSLDCNANQIPDECDIAEGSSLDIDGNTVPDECEHCGWIEWPVSDGGNGHYYRTVYSSVAGTTIGISWEDARLAASLAGGYLASIHSSAENDFVFNLIDAPRFWQGPDPSGNYYGPWLGGFQPPGAPEPAGGWTWDGGEPWTYANWAPAQPDDAMGNQDRAVFVGPVGTRRSSLWDDISQAYRAYGYVIETDDAHAISDCDGDGDVDELDYRCFVECLTGPGGGLLTNCCRYDYDGDFDVDTEDFSVFQSVYKQAYRFGCAVPPPGLIGWWPGDGNANDIIGGNDASALNGTTYGTGFVNQAFSFDGIDDSVVTSLPVGITGNAPRTMCAWIMSADTYPSTCCPTPFSFGTPTFGGTFGSFISAGIWWFWGYIDDMNTAVPTDTNWNLHCLTYDSTYAVYYLNRDAIASQPKNLSTGSSPLVIGNGIDATRTDTFFNGLVDEVQLYNHALSTQEVIALYDAGVNGTCRP